MKKLTLNPIKMLMIQISAFMMAFSPVVDGFAAETKAKELNEARVKELLIGLGMTKQQTIGSFYSKNKSQFPPRIQNLLGELVEKHKNEKMPGIEVASAKGSDGKIIPLVRVQVPGHMFNIEVHNSDKYFAKVGPTELTNIDINNFTDAIEKMYYNDYQFRRWADSQKKKNINQSVGMSVAASSSVKNEFSLPEINQEMWKKLTPEARVQYILNMRNMWKDAMVVLANRPGQKVKSNSKKTSSIDIMEEIWKLINTDAEAQGLSKGTEKRATGPVPGTTEEISYNDACLIAGYAVNYKGKSTTCNADDVKKRYNDPIYEKAHSDCTAGQIACNPMIYGTPEGRAVCVTIDSKSKSDFQVATHFNGPCERGHQGNGSDHDNRLSSEIKFLREDEKKRDKTRYGKDNELLTPDQLKEEVRKEQEKTNYEQTKYFLDGVMQSRYPDLVAMFKEGKIDDKVLKALSDVKQGFDSQIKEARKACKTSAATGRKQETNFWGACDQLQRREIFLAEYLLKNVGCKDEAVFDKDSLKCECTAKFNKAIVFPGQVCGGKIETGDACVPGKPGRDGKPCATEECSAEGKTPTGKDCKPTANTLCGKYGFILGEAGDPTQGDAAIMCVCSDGKGQPAKNNVGATLADIKAGKFTKEKCQPAGSGRPGAAGAAPAADDPNKCGVKPAECDTVVNKKIVVCEKLVKQLADGTEACRWVKKGDGEDGSSFWKDNKETFIFAGITAAVVYALYKSAPKPLGINPPGDQCKSGQGVCVRQCPNVNQVKDLNGDCGCRTPAPGLKIVDQTTCSTEPGASSTTVFCPDGVTSYDTAVTTQLKACPTTTCSDGSKVYVGGAACPTETPASKPKSTTTSDVQK